MKRIIWLVLLMTSSTALWAQVQVTVGSVNGAPGGKVLVPVMLSEGQAISALQFELIFDSTVLALSSGKAVLTGDLCSDHGIVSSVQNGTLKVAVFSGSLSLLDAGAGSVVQVLFDVAASAAQGTTAAVTLANLKACDATGGTVTTSAGDGQVTVNSNANQPATGQNSLIFPQIANGAVGQGAFYTIVILINQTTAPASAQVRFMKSDGTPFSLTIVGQGTGSQFSATVSPGGSAYLRTDGTGTLAVGYAEVNSTGPIGGTIMFGWRSGSGTTITEAGVGATDRKTDFSIPVIYSRNLSSTGVAIANPSASAVQLTVALKDVAGATVGTKTLDLAAGQHKAIYVHEDDLFPALLDQTSFLGTLHIAGPKVAVTAVKQNLQEGLITTFPIVEMK